jgi:CMP-N-acetylneuraminic acid synthetase
MGKKITAVVPVRKGSQRVLNKNTKPFGGSSLLELKIDLLKKIDLIDEIVVNSNCDKMLEIAENKGVTTHKREEYFASAASTNSETFQHLAENTEAEYILYAPVTCPLIKTETYQDAIGIFNNNNKIDSLVTVFPVKHHMWLNGVPLNYDPANSPNSQDLPDIYGINYGISLLSRELMIEKRNIIGNKPYFYELNEVESIDIDTELEFEFANFLYSNR